jgi:chemotaxis protein MotB
MRRRNKIDGSSNSNGSSWEIVFTGFILILLCFFIMLSSFATMEKAKIMQFVSSFAQAMSILPGGKKIEAGKTVLPDSSDIVEFDSEIAKISEDLNFHVRKNGLEKKVMILDVKGNLVMRFAEQVLFSSGSAKITPEAIPLLQIIGEILSTTSNFIRVEGHTDNLPISNQQFPSNWELSTARAVNVLRYFIEAHEFTPRRLSAAGYGEYQPLAPNNCPENFAKNRRVEVIIINQNDPERIR